MFGGEALGGGHEPDAIQFQAQACTYLHPLRSRFSWFNDPLPTPAASDEREVKVMHAGRGREWRATPHAAGMEHAWAGALSVLLVLLSGCCVGMGMLC
jgi:hypothetical protein